MNKKRRSGISDAINLINRAISHLEDISSEESDALYNLPESLQSSERGEAMENAISVLDESTEQLYEAVSALEELVSA